MILLNWSNKKADGGEGNRSSSTKKQQKTKCGGKGKDNNRAAQRRMKMRVQPSQLVFSLTHKEVISVTMCGAEQQEGVLSGRDECRAKSTPSLLSFLPPFSPSVSSLHLPEGRSSSSVGHRFHLLSFDAAFYLTSNSHYFNQDNHMMAASCSCCSASRTCASVPAFCDGDVACLHWNNRPAA